jgi:hypothetical protein
MLLECLTALVNVESVLIGQCTNKCLSNAALVFLFSNTFRLVVKPSLRINYESKHIAGISVLIIKCCVRWMFVDTFRYVTQLMDPHNG